MNIGPSIFPFSEKAAREGGRLTIKPYNLRQYFVTDIN